MSTLEETELATVQVNNPTDNLTVDSPTDSPTDNESKPEVEKLKSLSAEWESIDKSEDQNMNSIVQEMSAALAFLLHQESEFCNTKIDFKDRCNAFHSRKTRDYIAENDEQYSQKLKQQEENFNSVHSTYNNKYSTKWSKWKLWNNIKPNDNNSDNYEYENVLSAAGKAINQINEIKKRYRAIKQKLRNMNSTQRSETIMQLTPTPHGNNIQHVNFEHPVLNGIDDEKQMKKWLQQRSIAIHHTVSDSAMPPDATSPNTPAISGTEVADPFLEDVQEVLQDLTGIDDLGKILKSYEKTDIEDLKMTVAMNNLPMTKWQWKHVVWWIGRIDFLKPFASVFWEWRINGAELCNMNRQKIEWLIRCRHGYKDELNNITDKNIKDLLQERNKALILSVVTYKYETCYKLISLIKHKNSKDLDEFKEHPELIEQCQIIHKLIKFLRAESKYGPKAIWKLNAFYFNKIDNYLAAMIASPAIMDIFLSPDYFSTFMQDPSTEQETLIKNKHINIEQKTQVLDITITDLTKMDTMYTEPDDNKYENKTEEYASLNTESLKNIEAMNTAEIQDEFINDNKKRKVTDSLRRLLRTDIKHGYQKGLIDKSMDKTGGYFEKMGCKTCGNVIKTFDRIYLRIIWLLIFALSIGCLCTWFWMSRRSKSGIGTVMGWATENIAQRAIQSVEFQFFVPQMLLSIVIGGLHNGDITSNPNDYLDNGQFDDFFVQYKHYTVSENIVYALYMYESTNNTIIGSYTGSNDESIIYIFNGTCGIEYEYSNKRDVSAVDSCTFIPTERPWFNKANELGINGMGFTEPYLFWENEIGMSLVRKIEFEGVEVTFIVEFTTNTLQSVFNSFNSVIGGITYLVTPGGSVIASDIGEIDCIDDIISDCKSNNKLLTDSLNVLRRDLNVIENGNYNGNFSSGNDFEMISYSFKTVWLNIDDDVQEYALIVVAYDNEYLSDIESAQFWSLTIYILFTLIICIYICCLSHYKQKMGDNNEQIQHMQTSLNALTSQTTELNNVNNTQQNGCVQCQCIYSYKTISKCSVWWSLLTFVLIFLIWTRKVNPNWKETVLQFENEEYMMVQDTVVNYINVAKSIAQVVEESFSRKNLLFDGDNIPQKTDIFITNIMESFKGINGEYYAESAYIATPDGKFIGAEKENDINISNTYGNSLRIAVRDNSTDWMLRQFAVNPNTLQRANISNPIDQLPTYDPRCRPYYELSLQYMFDGSISKAFGGKYNTFRDFYLSQKVDSGLTSECINAALFYKNIWNITNITNGEGSLDTNTIYETKVKSVGVEYDILWSQYLFATTGGTGLTAMRTILNGTTGELLAIVAIDFSLDKLSQYLNDTGDDSDWYSWIMRGDTYEMVAASNSEVTIPLGDEDDDECVTITGTCYSISNLVPYNATQHPNYYIRIVSQEINLFYGTMNTEKDDEERTSFIMDNIEQFILPINTTSIPTQLELPLDLPDSLSGRILTYPNSNNPIELNWIIVTVININSVKIDRTDDAKIIGFILMVTFYAIYRIQDKIQQSSSSNIDNNNTEDDDEHNIDMDGRKYRKLKKKMEPLLERAATSNWKTFVSKFSDKFGNHPVTTSMATDFMAKQSNAHIETRKDGDLTLLLYSLQNSLLIYSKILKFYYSKYWNHFINFIIIAHLSTSMWLPENPIILAEEGLFDNNESKIAILIIICLIIIEVIDVIFAAIVRFIEFGVVEKDDLKRFTELKYGYKHKYVKQSQNNSTKWLIFFGGAYWRRFMIHIILIFLIIINTILLITASFAPFEYYFPLVPLLLIIRSERIRQFSIQFADAVYFSKEILISYLVLIFIVSILASSVFSEILNPTSPVDTFGSSIRSLITSFVFISTGENYNEIVYAATDSNNANVDGTTWFNTIDNTVSVINLLFFVIISIVGLYFFVPVMIFKFESAFDHSRKVNDNEVSQKKLKARINLLIASFIWLDMDDTGRISQDEFKLLIHSSVISKNVLLDAFHYDNNDNIQSDHDEISLYEFVSTLINSSSSFVIGIDSKEIGDDDSDNYFNDLCAMLECNFFRRDRNRHYILVYIIIPSVCIALLRGLGNISEDILNTMIHIFFIINFLEINLRWYVFGKYRYFSLIKYKNPKKVQQATYNWTMERGIKSSSDLDLDLDSKILKLSHIEKQWVSTNLMSIKPLTLWQKRTLSEIHKAELYLIWFSLIGIILTFILPNILSGYYYLFIQLYLFRLFTLVSDNQRLIALIFSIIPHTLNILAFLFLFIFFYSRIGCTLFGYTTNYVLNDIYETNSNANFNTLGSSILTLMQLMIGEGWHEIMYLHMIATRVEYSLYFIIYIVVVTLIISNIFIGLFLSEIEDLDNEQIHDEFLTQWMNNLNSNNMKNSKIIAQKRKNKLINQLNQLNQTIKNTKKQIKKIDKIINM